MFRWSVFVRELVKVSKLQLLTPLKQYVRGLNTTSVCLVLLWMVNVQGNAFLCLNLVGNTIRLPKCFTLVRQMLISLSVNPSLNGWIDCTQLTASEQRTKVSVRFHRANILQLPPPQNRLFNVTILQLIVVCSFLVTPPKSARTKWLLEDKPLNNHQTRLTVAQPNGTVQLMAHGEI